VVRHDRASIELGRQPAEAAETDRRGDALGGQLFADAHGLPAMVASEQSAADFDVHRVAHGRCAVGSIAISGSRFFRFGARRPTGCACTAATIASLNGGATPGLRPWAETWPFRKSTSGRGLFFTTSSRV